MLRLLICALVLLSSSVSQAKPTMSAADVRSSAAAVFHYFVWRTPKTSDSMIRKGDEVFVSALDEKERDITAAASIKYLRDSGYNAYAAWRVNKIHPNGWYLSLYICTPEVKAPDLIKWQVIHHVQPEKGSQFDGSARGYWVTMKK